MLGFETLTMAPIDTRVLERSLMTYAGIAWLNAYHKTVWKKLEGALEGPARDFWRRATKPI